MPIASTSANRVRVLIEKPTAHRPAKAPISDTGTAIIGISVARQVCRNRNTTAQHQQRGLEDRHVHFLDRGVDEARGVERDRVVDALGEAARFSSCILRSHRVGHFERVGAGLQVGRHADGRLAVERVGGVVVERAELEPGDVLQPQHARRARGAHHDLAELLGLDQAALRGDGVDDVLARRRRLGADAAGGVLRVLRAQRGGDVRGGDAEARHLLRVEPDAHRVVARAEDGDVGDAGQALELVDDVERGVVREEQRVALVVGRDQRHHQQDVERALLHDHAVAAHLVGQARQRELHAVVDLEDRGVDVGAGLEGRGDLQVAVRGRGRAEVGAASPRRRAAPRSARRRCARASRRWRRGRWW